MFAKKPKKFSAQSIIGLSLRASGLLVFLSIALISCGNLSEVQRYATNSEKKLKTFSAVEYSFGINCQQKCLYRALESSSFQTTAQSCDCKDEKTADKNIENVQSVLSSYFNGMARLSDKKQAVLSFNALEKTLVEGKFIKKEALKPYSKLGGLITELLAEQYSVKKIASVVENANPNVIYLLETLAVIIEQNLIPTLQTRQSELTRIYHDLHSDSSNSSFEKFTIHKAYFSELDALSTQDKALRNYVKVLRKISEGHQALFENKHRLKKKEIKKRIAVYAAEINEILELL